MRIQEFHLEGVRGLASIDLDFSDPATNRVRPRTVIAGSNGTGKTTVLDTIHALASLILNEQDQMPPTWLIASEGSIAWMKLTDLPLRDARPQQLTLYSVSERDSLALIPKDSHYGHTGLPHFEQVYGPRSSTISNLRQRIQQAEEGKETADPLPNILYFPSEQRELQPKRKGQVLGGEDIYRWTYRFSDSEKWEGSLESFLVAMDYRDLMDQRRGPTNTAQFPRYLKVINQFLQGKQIVGVEERAFRVLVRADNGEEFSIDHLSSGEKQILLMLGEIQRRIRKGSVVLIDEPEIHLHPRWQRLLVRALTDLCTEHDAQLIITTHSEETANAVYEHELILLDAIFAQEQLR